MADYMNLRQKYETQVRPALAEEFSIANAMAVPKVTKVVVNMGTGDLLKDKATKERFMGDLATITGQAPKVQEARISVAGFGIRQGNLVGLTTTLRGARMYDFLEKLITIALPRLRDFRGVPAGSFDKRGNYTLGLTEYTVFPEIDLAKVERSHGMQITIVTTAKTPEEAKRMLALMGMPFAKEE